MNVNATSVGGAGETTPIGQAPVVAQTKLEIGNKWTANIIKAVFQNLGGLITGQTKWKEVKFQAMISLANNIANEGVRTPWAICQDVSNTIYDGRINCVGSKLTDSKHSENLITVDFENVSTSSSHTGIHIDAVNLRGKTSEEIQNFAKQIKQNNPKLVAVKLYTDGTVETPLSDAKTNSLFLNALCQEGCVPKEVILGHSLIEDTALVTVFYHMQKRHGTEFAMYGREYVNDNQAYIVLSEPHYPYKAGHCVPRMMENYVAAARMMIFFEADKEDFRLPEGTTNSGDILNAIRDAKLRDISDDSALSVYDRL